MVHEGINWISVFLIVLFLLPLVCGAFQPLTDSRILQAFHALLGSAAFLISACLSIMITDAVFNNAESIPAKALRCLPVLREAIAGQDILAYVFVVLLLMLVFNGLLHLLLLPIFKRVLLPLSYAVAVRLNKAGRLVFRLVCAAWQLPRSAWLVLLFSLIFNLYLTLSNDSVMRDYISSSQAYRWVEAGAIEPLAASKAAQVIPPLIDSAVNKTVDSLSPEGRRLLIRVYINGVTVEDAVRSTPDIDNMAIDLVDAETDDYKKARLLYDWICSKISYDKAKADAIAVDAFSVTSGASTAFLQKTGVCFDKACLYVSMCRAVHIPVRLITGEGFNGTSWEDHSWNQIYDDKLGRWVNVDTTFGGNGGSYFDRIGFFNDHRGEEIQGEWQAAG